MILFKGFNPRYYPQGSMTQGFGENRKLYFDAFGMEGHNGEDYVAPWGTPIYPLKEGIVVEHKDSPTGYGKYIRILTEEFGGVCEEWVYAHLSEIKVQLGDTVTTETCVGLMGNTGFVVSGATPFWKHNPYAGTHLHLGKRLVKMFKSKDKTWNISYGTGHKGTILNYDNGFMGSIPFSEDVKQMTPPTSNQILTLKSALNNLRLILERLLVIYK